MFPVSNVFVDFIRARNRVEMLFGGVVNIEVVLVCENSTAGFARVLSGSLDIGSGRALVLESFCRSKLRCLSSLHSFPLSRVNALQLMISSKIVDSLSLFSFLLFFEFLGFNLLRSKGSLGGMLFGAVVCIERPLSIELQVADMAYMLPTSFPLFSSLPMKSLPRLKVIALEIQ